MSELTFEICVDSVAGVRAARDAGADRVELCADLLEGGITPSLGTILVARKIADIKLHVIIRPRGGDFLYDEDELAAMEADIASAKSAGVDGVVFGVLERDGRIDVEATERLVARARPVSVTFHRAFDMTPEPLVALEALCDLGVDRVLTSGQEPTAYEGAEKIAELIKASVGRIIVMPGGGITARNASRVASGSNRYSFMRQAPRMHTSPISPTLASLPSSRSMRSCMVGCGQPHERGCSTNGRPQTRTPTPAVSVAP